MSVFDRVISLWTCIVNNYFEKFCKFAVKLNKDNGLFVSNTVAKYIQDGTKNYYTFKLNNKKASAYNYSRLETNTADGELAIVLQGLPELKEDFTLETVRLYKKIFPRAIIIFSTWDCVSIDIIKQFEDEGCTVVINDSLKNNGPWNVNCQICTSYSGIKRAVELGAKYVLKNRSDLRIYRKMTFEYLKGLLQLFPLGDDMVKLKSRVISLSGLCQGQIFYPYWIQDLLYFGKAEDLLDLFSIPYDERQVPLGKNLLIEKYGSECSAYERWLLEGPEIYITKQFLNKYVNLKNTVRDSIDVIKKYFIIIGQEDLDIVWPKYKRFLVSSYDRNMEYDGCSEFDDLQKNINFQTFVALYTGTLQYKEWMESVNKKMTVRF